MEGDPGGCEFCERDGGSEVGVEEMFNAEEERCDGYDVAGES